MMRILNIVVIAALILAASFVYKIKFESTLQAEQLAKLRGEVRRERDAIATLRAQWARLDNPTRIQGLAGRHLLLKPLVATQIDSLDRTLSLRLTSLGSLTAMAAAALAVTPLNSSSIPPNLRSAEASAHLPPLPTPYHRAGTILQFKPQPAAR